jgi:hypothetical protein
MTAAGMAALNLMVRDVLDKFAHHNATLQQVANENLDLRMSVRVCP